MLLSSCECSSTLAAEKEITWTPGNPDSIRSLSLYKHLQRYPHKTEAAEHFLRAVTASDPATRAFNNQTTLLRSHPFFWDDTRANTFLIALGELATPNFEVPASQEIEQLLANCSSNNNSKISNNSEKWYNLIDRNLLQRHLKSFQSDKKKRQHESGYGLLRFIRNCYRHHNDDREILDKPYFLFAFPKLVITMWAFCLHSEFRENIALKSYFTQPFNPTLDIPTQNGWF